MQFEHLRLSEPILRAVRSAGYADTTPIQAQAIPHVLAGRDLFGCAQTGTGKTAAFALPILDRLAAEPVKTRRIRALVVTPTSTFRLEKGSLDLGKKTPACRGCLYEDKCFAVHRTYLSIYGDGEIKPVGK